MKYKGIVIKLTKNKAIVTTEDFQCYYIKRSPTICVGKEVEFTNKEIIEKTHTLARWALSVACVIFLITSFIYFTGIIDIDNILYSPQVFAYVSIDINPSFEMEIDYKGRVLNLVPLDDDARFIFNNIKFDKVNISKVIDNIIEELKANGDISEKTKEHILISSTLDGQNEESNHTAPEKRQKLDIIMDGIKKDIENSYKADVYLLQGDIKQREDAKSKGISTGRYIVYKSLEKELSIEDVKKATVADLIESLESDKLEVMPTPTPTPTPSPTQTLTTLPIDTSKETPTPMTSTQQSSNTPSNIPSNTPSNTPAPTQTLISTPEPIDLMYRRFESSNYRGYFIRSESFRAGISSYVAPVEDSIFKIVPGLAEGDCISFESTNHPGHYLKHENFEIILKKYEDTELFKADATFRIVSGLADGSMISFQSFNYPDRYIRHRDYNLYIEEISTELDKKDATYIELKVE